MGGAVKEAEEMTVRRDVIETHTWPMVTSAATSFAGEFDASRDGWRAMDDDLLEQNEGDQRFDHWRLRRGGCWGRAAMILRCT